MTQTWAVLGYPEDGTERPRTVWHVLADEEDEARRYVLGDAEAAGLKIVVYPTPVRRDSPEASRGISYRGGWPSLVGAEAALMPFGLFRTNVALR